VQTPLQTMKTFLFLALVGFAAAECPNACSGHGTCGAKDSCSCYQNYQGNDCSERTCYFGIAHVDSPKGDLNADGIVSGALTTVVTGSEVYPWGTTEQFPNTDANEGHFYMECSNKGICDRKSGECDCFDGYTGTACARAACPNDCSGHGTCESIKELAEMRSFDTNEHDVPTTRVAGSSAHHSFDSAIEESYSYNLWDQDKTMGCKCDPVYYGADCSLKKCKYGVDPLFYDHEGVIRQTTVVHVGSGGTASANLGGTFKIVFYDVFGEKYVTKPIAARGASAETVKLALQALPNGVIAKNNQDVTAEQPNAVSVSAQKSASAPGVDQAGGIGGGIYLDTGNNGEGAGLGTKDDTGSEYTISFKTNPGILKSIEIDTRNVNNQGSPDYWVANARQGQFSSRYTTNLGRVQVLMYGSKHLYTNTDLTSTGSSQLQDAVDLVKVGGQEFRVVTAKTNKLILDEPYLGASIQPVTVDTGIFAVTAADASSFTKGATSGSDRIKVTGTGSAGTVTAAQAASVGDTAEIYVNDCAMTVNQYTTAVGGDTLATDGSGNTIPTLAAGTYTTAGTVGHIGVVPFVDDGHDCSGSLLTDTTVTYPIQRRSDDTSNQNLYRTSGDVAAAAASGMGVTFQRGSAVGDITMNYFTAANPAATPATPETAAAVSVVAIDDTASPKTTTITTIGATITSGAANDKFYFHTFGPFVADTFTAGAAGTDTIVFEGDTKREAITQHFGTAVAATANFHLTTNRGAADPNVATGKALLIGGRRYRVKAVSGTAVTLSETFAGGQLRQVCSGCVTEQDASDHSLSINEQISGIPLGAIVGTSTNLNFDNFAMVTAAVTEAATQKISVGTSPNRIANNFINGATALSGATDDLYTIQGLSAAGYSYSTITESATGTTYQYVAQCSNRGSCDASTGLCKCFKGYSNDNCDTQNMLAA